MTNFRKEAEYSLARSKEYLQEAAYPNPRGYENSKEARNLNATIGAGYAQLAQAYIAMSRDEETR